MNKSFVTIALVMVISIFAIHTIYMFTEGARHDFTQAQLFSLTDGTHQIIDKMKTEAVKPVSIKLYFSATTGKSLPKFVKNFIIYEAYIRNLLREYQDSSEGKITIELIDPKPDSDEAEDAEDYRLDGKPINNEGDKFYFGLVFETQTGSKDVIDFLWPEKQETLEYEISKKLYNLIWPKKKRIAVVSSLEPLPDNNNPYMAQMMQMQGKKPSEPWLAMKVLEESYTVTRLGDVDSISHDDYDLLMIIHPKSFSDKLLWSIDEWVVTGGETMVFLDPYSLEDKAPQNPQQPFAQLQYKPASSLGALLTTWGLKRADNMFAVDYELGLKRPVDRSGMSRKVINDLVIDEKNAMATLNQDLPIFNGINNLRFFLAGALETLDDMAGEAIPLITTTDQGDTLLVKPGFGDGGDLAYTDLQEPEKLLNRYSPSGKVVLAYLVKGQVKSAYPEGTSFPKESPQVPPGMPPDFKMPPPEDAEMISKEAVPDTRFAESRLVVFADSDFITNQLAFQQSMFGVQAVNDNYKVLINSIDYLMGAKELMAVRSRKNISRPFDRFDRIEEQADRNVLEEEQKIRTDIESFQEKLRTKQSSISQKDAGLFQKKMSDEIQDLNDRIRNGNKELREIRKAKRGILEAEETFIWYLVLLLMPVVICAFGVASFLRRRSRQMSVRR